MYLILYLIYFLANRQLYFCHDLVTLSSPSSSLPSVAMSSLLLWHTLLMCKSGIIRCSRENVAYSALKSGLVLVLLPFLEGPRTGPVPESFRMQEPWTGTAKKRKKLVVTGLGMNTIKHVLCRQK